MKLGKRLLLPLIPALLASATAQASDEDPRLAASVGMGGAAIADPVDNTAIAVNPAAIGLAERYQLSGQFRLGQRLDWGATASLVDAQTSVVSMGVTYRYSTLEPPLTPATSPGWTVTGTEPAHRERDHHIAVGLAYPILDRKLSFGIGGSLTIYDHDVGGKGVSGDIEAGIAGSPVEGLTLGLVGQNFLPLKENDKPIGVGVGGRFERGPAATAFDVVYQIEDGGKIPVELRVGAEVNPASVSIRAGYRMMGPQSEHWASAGFGYFNERGSFDYAIEVPLGPKLFIGSFVHRLAFRVRA